MKKTIKNRLFFTLGLLGSGFLGYMFTSWLIKSLGSPEAFANKPSIFIIVLSFITAILAGLFLHEFGHYLMGRLFGLKLYYFAFGPFSFYRKSGNEPLRFQWNRNLAAYGGMVAMLPKPEQKGLFKSYAWFVAGGPLMSLLSLFIFYFLYHRHGNGPLELFLLMMSLLGFATFLATTIPARSNGMLTDRKKLQRLLKGGMEAENELILFEELAKAAVNEDYRLLDDSRLQILNRDPEAGIQVVALLLRAFKARAEGDLDKFENMKLEISAFSEQINVKPYLETLNKPV